jgi:hypothetical protein
MEMFTDYEDHGGMRKLPTYKGYTVDVYLRQFRKIERGQPWEIFCFSSDKGDQLLAELIRILPKNHPLNRQIMSIVLGDDWPRR